MIAMKAPAAVASLSIGGTSYKVVDGQVNVIPAHAKSAIALGCKMLTSGNADELIASDFEAALAKASAAIELHPFQLPKGTLSLSIDGQQYTADATGYLELPESAVALATMLGAKPLPSDGKKAPLERQGDTSVAALEAAGAGSPTKPTTFESPLPFATFKTFDAGTAREWLISKGVDTAVLTDEQLGDAAVREFLAEQGVMVPADADHSVLETAMRDYLEAQEIKANPENAAIKADLDLLETLRVKDDIRAMAAKYSISLDGVADKVVDLAGVVGTALEAKLKKD